MQRAIWIITFFIVLGGAYFWFYIHENEVLQVKEILSRIDDQSQSINVIGEDERRLELKYIGHGQHLKDIQDKFNKHYKQYVAKMDSINSVFDDISFTITQVEERFNSKIDKLKLELTDLNDTFLSYKHSNQGTVMGLVNDVATMKDDISAIQKTLTEKQAPKK